MKKLAIIHTTSATIQSLTLLAKNTIENIEVINLLDDSILKDMIEERQVDAVEKRWITYAQMAELAGAEVVLSACSTVGEFAERANELLDIPVYRIDEAMAEKAIELGTKIAVFATLGSTLKPTVALVERKAKEAGKNCEITTNLVKGAYETLMAGDKQTHDQMILEEVKKSMENAQVIVLAQASMASALDSMTQEEKEKVLTSPQLGMQRLKEKLEG